MITVINVEEEEIINWLHYAVCCVFLFFLWFVIIISK